MCGRGVEWRRKMRSKEWESRFFMYERASLGRWLASKRDVRVVFFLVFASFLKIWAGSKK